MPDAGAGERIAAREEALSDLGTLRTGGSTTGKRAANIPELEQQISEAEQALAADSLGLEYRHSSAQRGTDTRRLCRQDPHRRAQQVPRFLWWSRALRHNQHTAGLHAGRHYSRLYVFSH